jgi:hypothetical protein
MITSLKPRILPDGIIARSLPRRKESTNFLNIRDFFEWDGAAIAGFSLHKKENDFDS